MSMYSQVRHFLRDFQDEFDHSSGRSRHSYNSAESFYEKWRVLIALVTGVSFISINRDNIFEMYCVASTCALRIRSTFNLR
jgi:hypothetical protein